MFINLLVDSATRYYGAAEHLRLAAADYQRRYSEDYFTHLVQVRLAPLHVAMHAWSPRWLPATLATFHSSLPFLVHEL